MKQLIIVISLVIITDSCNNPARQKEEKNDEALEDTRRVQHDYATGRSTHKPDQG